MAAGESVRPPLGELIRYRAYGARLPARYQDWVTEDVTSGRRFRISLRLIAVAAVAIQALFALLDSSSFEVFYLFVPLVALAVNFLPRTRLRLASEAKFLRYQRGELEQAALLGSPLRSIVLWAAGGLAASLAIVLAVAAFS